MERFKQHTGEGGGAVKARRCGSKGAGVADARAVWPGPGACAAAQHGRGGCAHHLSLASRACRLPASLPACVRPLPCTPLHSVSSHPPTGDPPPRTPAVPRIREVVQRTLGLPDQPPIARAGQAFVREQLTPEALSCYWLGALQRYAEIYFLPQTPAQAAAVAGGGSGGDGNGAAGATAGEAAGETSGTAGGAGASGSAAEGTQSQSSEAATAGQGSAAATATAT